MKELFKELAVTACLAGLIVSGVFYLHRKGAEAKQALLLTEHPKPVPKPQPPPKDCRLAEIRVSATSWAPKGGMPKGVHSPPVMILAAYLAANGHSVKGQDCPWTWQPPEWKVEGRDNRGVLLLSTYPWSADLIGAPGSVYSIIATDTKSGLQGRIQVTLAGVPEGPQVVKR